MCHILPPSAADTLVRVSELAKEFGIKKIHFVPVDGGVLEYGTPSSEEVVLLELLGLTVSQMMHPGSPQRFFRLIGELFLCLRLLIAVEESNLIEGFRKVRINGNCMCCALPIFGGDVGILYLPVCVHSA